MEKIWQIRVGEKPLIATAIHDGHVVRPEVAAILAVSETERRREEDPFTSKWTSVAETQIIGLRSRFEVDLNRPREKAVYRKPEDAWGLQVWRTEPSEEIVARSLAEYDAFYSEVEGLFKNVERRHGQFVVFDIHTYNHRRAEPGGPAADPVLNPEVNVGTGTMDRNKWATVVDRFIADLQAFDFLGRHLDVRENVKFRGGEFPRWIHQTFPESGCALALEFKKFFMDEWSGEPDAVQIDAIGSALKSTATGVLETLQQS